MGFFWLATGGVLGRVRQYTPIIIEATEAKTNRSLPPVQSVVCQLSHKSNHPPTAIHPFPTSELYQTLLQHFLSF